MGYAQIILTALNIVLPEVITFITLVKHKDGSATVFTELNEGDAAEASRQKLVADWRAAHPGK